MRIGVIGLGSIGRRHAINLQALGCDVFGFDVSYEAVSAAPSGVKAYQWIELCFAPSDFDALVFATPWDRHIGLVNMAVHSRTPFFVEKPLGSLDQLPRWRELVAMDLPVNQVGYMLRFHPIAKRMHDCQALGGTFSVRCDMASWPGMSYGPMLLEMSHEIDLALWCGAPLAVTDVSATASRLSIGLGISWTVDLDSTAAQYWREWAVFRRSLGYQQAFRAPSELGDQMYVDELAHFLECVREQKPTRVPLSEGLRTLEVCAQVEASCQSSV